MKTKRGRKPKTLEERINKFIDKKNKDPMYRIPDDEL